MSGNNEGLRGVYIKKKKREKKLYDIISISLALLIVFVGLILILMCTFCLGLSGSFEIIIFTIGAIICVIILYYSVDEWYDVYISCESLRSRIYPDGVKK